MALYGATIYRGMYDETPAYVAAESFRTLYNYVLRQMKIQAREGEFGAAYIYKANKFTNKIIIGRICISALYAFESGRVELVDRRDDENNIHGILIREIDKCEEVLI